jgi:hypothetical protein
MQQITPKEEAKKLIDEYLNASFNCKDCDMPFCDVPCTMLNLTEAKECALIAVNKIIEILWHTYKNENEYKHWQEVKKEILIF